MNSLKILMIQLVLADEKFRKELEEAKKQQQLMKQ